MDPFHPPRRGVLSHAASFQMEFQGLMEHYSVNEALVEEIERLREENRRLKSNY